jgi:hypothetical protein
MALSLKHSSVLVKLPGGVLLIDGDLGCILNNLSSSLVHKYYTKVTIVTFFHWLRSY